MNHEHKWIEKERFYASPAPGDYRNATIPEILAKQILFGLTTILYTCEICNELNKVEILGKSLNESSKT